MKEPSVLEHASRVDPEILCVHGDFGRTKGHKWLVGKIQDTAHIHVWF